MRIVIVGAGVAGCILTRSLSRLRGAEVVCLERVRAGEHVDFGTGHYGTAGNAQSPAPSSPTG